MATDTENVELVVDLPASLHRFVTGAVKGSGAESPQDYIRKLIQEDRARRLAALEVELLEASKGPFIELAEDDFASEENICDTLARKRAAAGRVA